MVLVDNGKNVVHCLLDDVKVAPNEGVGIIDLVTDPGNELPQGSELVSLQKLPLKILLLGDHTGNLESAGHITVRIEDGVRLQEVESVIYLFFLPDRSLLLENPRHETVLTWLLPVENLLVAFPFIAYRFLI